MFAILDELTNPQFVDIGDDAEPDHLVCECTPDISLCGHDVSTCDFLDEPIPDDRLCVVCNDLITAPCKFCGKI